MATESTTTTKRTTTVDTPDATTTSHVVVAQSPLWATPIIVRREKKKKRGRRNRKRRYTRGTKNFQRLLLGGAKAGHRVANAFPRENRTIFRRSKRSSRRRKDGIIRDAFKNWSRGLNKGSRELGKAPWPLAKRFNTKQTWRTLRSFTPFFFG
jgi:hypothetical protein